MTDGRRTAYPTGGGRRVVCVLGSSGWIGRELVRQAPPGVDLVGAARHPGPGRVVVRSASDLATVITERRVGTVINCVGASSGDQAALQAANVEHTRDVAEVCLDLGVRMLHLGSAAEYGACDDSLLTEDSVPSPQSPYGRTKLAGTEELLRAADRGLDVMIARPFNILGPHQPRTTPPADFAAAVNALTPPGGTILVRDSSLVRDFVSLERVADSLLALEGLDFSEATNAEGSVVNVCSGRGVSFGELVDAMAQARGITVTVVDTAPGGVPRAVGDPTRLHALIGRPRPEATIDLARAALRLDG